MGLGFEMFFQFRFGFIDFFFSGPTGALNAVLEKCRKFVDVFSGFIDTRSIYTLL
jgi:hypothetical protein